MSKNFFSHCNDDATFDIIDFVNQCTAIVVQKVQRENSFNEREGIISKEKCGSSIVLDFFIINYEKQCHIEKIQKNIVMISPTIFTLVFVGDRQSYVGK